MYQTKDISPLRDPDDPDVGWMLDLVRARMNVDCAVIVALDGSRAVLSLLAHEATDQRGPRGVQRMAADRTFCEYVLQTNDVMAVADVAQEHRAQSCSLMRAEGYQSYLGAPVAGPAENAVAVIAVLNRTPRLWSAQDREIIQRSARILAKFVLLRASIETVRILSADGRPTLQAIRP